MQDKKLTFFGQIASLSDFFFFLFLDAVSKSPLILTLKSCEVKQNGLYLNILEYGIFPNRIKTKRET